MFLPSLSSPSFNRSLIEVKPQQGHLVLTTSAGRIGSSEGHINVLGVGSNLPQFGKVSFFSSTFLAPHFRSLLFSLLPPPASPSSRHPFLPPPHLLLLFCSSSSAFPLPSLPATHSPPLHSVFSLIIPPYPSPLHFPPLTNSCLLRLI